MRKLGLRGPFKNIFYRVAEIDSAALQRGEKEEEGKGEGEGEGGRE